MFTSFSYSDQQKDIIDVKQTAGANLKLVKNVWVHPSSTQRQLWNTWITLCLVYNGIVIPVRIAFDLIEDPAAFIFDRFIDGSFILDIFINFETGIIPDNSSNVDAVMERSRVYRLYFWSWFPVDLISSIPLDVVLQYGLGLDSSGGTARSPKLLRSFIRLILKSARMTRMMKSFRLLEWIEERSLLGLDSADLIRFVVFVFFLLHWSACIFYFIDSNLCAATPDRSIFIELDMETLPFMDKYTASFYWAFATVLTIGYGDVSALCTATRVFSLLVMLVGSVGYAYGISMVMGVMQRRREQNREFKALMSSVEEYAQFRRLPSDMKDDMREYFTFVNARNEFINEKNILDQLTPELRKHILHHVNSELIQSVDFFRELQFYEYSLEILPKTLLVEIISAMQTRVLRPGEVVLREGDTDNSLYLITKDGGSFGEACFLSRSLSAMNAGVSYRMSMSHLEIERVKRMSYTTEDTGDDAGPKLLKQNSNDSTSSEQPPQNVFNYSQPYTVIATTYSDVRFVTRDDFDLVLKKFTRQKRIKINSFLKIRCEKLLSEIAEYEDDLRERFPTAWEDYLEELYRSVATENANQRPALFPSDDGSKNVDNNKGFFANFRKRSYTLNTVREAIPTDIAPDAPSLGKSRRFWESSTKSLAQDIDQGAQSISISPDPFMQIENHGHTTPVLGMSSTSRVFGAKRSTDSIDLELPHRSAPATARRSDSALHRSKVLDSFVPEVSGYYTNFPDQCSDITDVMESEGLISLSNVEGTRTLRRSSFERRPTVEDAPAGAETIVPAAWRNSRIDSHISEEDNENTDSAAAHESLPVFLDVGPHELESSQIDGAGLSPKSQRPFSFTSPTG